MSQQKQEFDNTNRFVLFKQDEPKGDERDADYSGTLNVNGAEFFIDGWVKTTQAGKRMLSGRIKPKAKAKTYARGTQGPDDFGHPDDL